MHAKRRGGRGFYRDRGQPYRERTGPRHESRDRQRSPEEQKAAALGRQLAELAKQYPRHQGPLNRARNQVLVQSRSEEWKQEAVLGSLGAEPLTVGEISEETNLDERSIGEVLTTLEAKGAAAKCNRNGEPVVIRRDGKPAERVYWRRPSWVTGR